MVGHQVKYKNTFLELELPTADLRRLVTCPGRVAEKETVSEPEPNVTPTLLARRGMPPLRHLCSPFELEQSVNGDCIEFDADASTDEEQPEPRYKAHFVNLGGEAKKLNFRGLLAELKELRRAPQVAAPVPEPSDSSTPTEIERRGARVRPLEAVPAPEDESQVVQSKRWADIESDDESPVAQVAQSKRWADIESDDESPVEVKSKPVSWADMESDAESVQATPKPKPVSWADMESDDESVVTIESATTQGQEEPRRAPTPPRVRPRWAGNEDSQPVRRRVRAVSWAQPVSRVAGSAAEAQFAPATPRETETVNALAETAATAQQAMEADGWTTVQKKERKSVPTRADTRTPARPVVRETARAPARPVRETARATTEKIFVRLEDGEFPVVRRLIGPGGANLRRIGDACKGTVQLRGAGCGGAGPLHLLITAEHQHLAAACRQARALVDDVRDQYERSRATRARH